jgi:hypothetical protein
MTALIVTTSAWAQSEARTAEGKFYREGNAWVQEVTGTIPAARNVRVQTETGSVRVQGGGTQQITYTVRKKSYTGSEEQARRDLESFRVTARIQGETALIEGSGRSWRRGGVEFNLQVPQSTEVLRVETQGGAVGANSINGRVDLETAGGSIEVDRIGGAVAATTMGGSISVGTAGGDVNVETAGGSIHIESANGKLTATTRGGSVEVGTAKLGGTIETAGGSIRIRQSGGDMRISTAGGSIDAGDINGTVELRTAGGNIRLGSARGAVEAETAGGGIRLAKLQSGARAETAAGGITAEFVGRRLTESSLETTAGDVVVYLADGIACTVNAAIDMASGGHRISTDFPELKIRKEGGEYGPSQWFANGNLNGGGPTLKIRTDVGDIEIRKGSQQ